MPPINRYAERLRGVQFGLFNCYRKTAGVQIGLLNFSLEGPVPFFPPVYPHF